MAFDVAILDGQGYPVDQVSLSVDEHYAVMVFARRMSLPLLQNMSDYYEDVEYTPDEVLGLVQEIRAALADSGSDAGSARMPLSSLLAISVRAAEGRVGLSALAD